MRTLREFLRSVDWSGARLFVLDKEDEDDFFSEDTIRETTSNDPILDRGFGGADMPSFVLYTKDSIYFPGTYDGSTWVESIPRDPDFWLRNPNAALPYVGGG